MFITGDLPMFKHLFTLLRGGGAEAAEAVALHQALPLLRQQIRDCAAAVDAARRAVAVAMAQNDQEATQCARLSERIADLEARTRAALDQGREDLAREGAEAIATLEAERDASVAAQARFTDEIARLRGILCDGEARLLALRRGQRLAAAAERTSRLRHRLPDGGLSVLREAEATLARLQARQAEADATASAMTELEAEGSAECVRDRLAEAGCGAPRRSRAEDVLSRLRAAAAQPA
jgi:phage shock protein A